MFLEKKTKRAMETAHTLREEQQSELPENEQPELTESEWKPEKEEIRLEKHDMPALMCSAYLILLPVCLAALLVISLAAYFFIVR